MFRIPERLRVSFMFTSLKVPELMTVTEVRIVANHLTIFQCVREWLRRSKAASPTEDADPTTS